MWISGSDRNVIPNSIISVMMARKMMKKGCEAYLAYVLETKKRRSLIVRPSDNERISGCISRRIAKITPRRDVEISIDLLPITSSI